MNAERLSRIERLYHSAREQEPGEREGFLKQACVGDEELRREVESLLAYETATASVMAAPPLDVAATVLAADQRNRMLGRTLGHYRIDAWLDAGGMAEVYRATDTRLGRAVAVKILSQHLATYPEAMARFEREAKAVAALSHPNILAIHDFGDEQGLAYAVTELLEGETLRDRIKRGPLDWRAAVEIALAIAEGLGAAHAKGITHRDLKPGNVFLTSDERVKILDFGLAQMRRVVSGEEPSQAPTRSAITETGMVIGTAAYMSPEQAEGKRVDQRSDIFSFGSVLYEMLTGQRAFRGDSTVSTLAAIIHQEPQPISELVDGVPPDLEEISQRCLEKDLERRFQTAPDLKAALLELDAEGTLSGATVAGGGSRMWRVLVAVIFTAVAGWVWFRFVRTGGEVEAPPKVVPFTSFLGNEVQPAFSPDGKQLAFVWNGEKQDYSSDIYVKLIGAGTPLRLTSNPRYSIEPAWSPDGRYIAFRRLTPGKVGGEILIVPALGGPERKVGSAAAVLPGLTWAPDGKSLVIPEQASLQEPSSLFLVSVESGEKRRITFPPGPPGDGAPAFSPDNRSLAFARSHKTVAADAYVVAVGKDGVPIGEPRRVTHDGRLFRKLSWAADSRSLVIDSKPDLRLWRIWIGAAYQSRPPEVIAAAGEEVSGPSVAPRGNRLAYILSSYTASTWRIPGPASTRKGSSPTRLIASTRADVGAVFSPDGKRIAFVSTRSGYKEVWVCDSQGLNPVQLTSYDGVNTDMPGWSADGNQIVFGAQKDGNWDLYTISADGGMPHRLTTETTDEMWPQWSKDGKWIFFSSTRTGTQQLWKMPSTGGPWIQITRKGGQQAMESVDGKFLYYSISRVAPGIWRVPVEGGEEIQVADRGRIASWTLSEAGILERNIKDNSSSTLELFSFKSRQWTQFRKLSGVDLTAHGISISPNGEWILYTVTEGTGTDIMLMENFR